jgi:predicted nuclease of predicted toxin-antitoxin system
MKLLFDQNISFRVVKKLQRFFQGCMHVSACNLNDCEDSEIWNYAKETEFVIVTFDSDFYDISLINGHPPKIIWIRTGNLSTSEIANLMVNNQQIINAFIKDSDFEEISCLELE